MFRFFRPSCLHFLQRPFDPTLPSFEDSKIDVFLAIELLQAQKKVGEDMISHFLDDKSPEANLVRDNLAMIDKLLLQKQRLDDAMRREFLDPINKYKQQYREIEERQRERKRRLDEMDKLTDDVKKYTTKSDARLNATQKRLESTTQAYEELNAELMEDMPRLIHDKEVFFHPMTAVLLDSQYEFYRSMTEQLALLRDRTAYVRPAGRGARTDISFFLYSQIDRKAVHTHPSVLTPRQQSAAHKTYSVFGSGPVQHTSAPAQQQPVAVGGAPPGLPGRPGLPPRGPAGVRFRAQWDFATDIPEELPFRAGDTVNVLEQTGDWWKAEMNGRQGLVPANYLLPM